MSFYQFQMGRSASVILISVITVISLLARLALRRGLYKRESIRCLAGTTTKRTSKKQYTILKETTLHAHHVFRYISISLPSLHVYDMKLLDMAFHESNFFILIYFERIQFQEK